MASGQYAYVYQLAPVDGGGYAIVGNVDPITGFVKPVDVNVGVSAGTPVVDDGGNFTATIHSQPDQFQFVDAAFDSSFGEGFIAEFVPNGQSSGLKYFFTNDQYLGPGGANATDGAKLSTEFENDDMLICFLAGTKVLGVAGEILVEDLKPGDLVLTSDHRPVPVRWVGRQTVSRRFSDELRLPVRLKANALGENVPSRDLLVSSDHALFVEGVLIHAGALVNGTSIVREPNVPMTFTYYHLEVEDHSLILAENTPAETFIDNVDRMAFDNWDEYQALYPEGKAIVEMAYPRAKAYRQVPRAIREKLAERGLRLYGADVSSAA